jgi:hypothetical protein
MPKYKELALQYAEKYGIINYKLSGRYMTYIINFRLDSFGSVATYKRKVNLDTLEVKTVRLKKYNPDGWKNR